MILDKKCNVISICVTELSNFVSSIGNSQLHPRLVKVPKEISLVKDLKFSF